MVCKIVVAVVMITVFLLLFKVDHTIDVGWYPRAFQFVSFEFVEIFLYQNANAWVIHVHTGVSAAGGMIEVENSLRMYERHPTEQVPGISANSDTMTTSPSDIQCSHTHRN